MSRPAQCRPAGTCRQGHVDGGRGRRHRVAEGVPDAHRGRRCEGSAGGGIGGLRGERQGGGGTRQRRGSDRDGRAHDTCYGGARMLETGRSAEGPLNGGSTGRVCRHGRQRNGAASGRRRPVDHRSRHGIAELIAGLDHERLGKGLLDHRLLTVAGDQRQRSDRARLRACRESGWGSSETRDACRDTINGDPRPGTERPGDARASLRVGDRGRGGQTAPAGDHGPGDVRAGGRVAEPVARCDHQELGQGLPGGPELSIAADHDQLGRIVGDGAHDEGDRCQTRDRRGHRVALRSGDRSQNEADGGEALRVGGDRRCREAAAARLNGPGHRDPRDPRAVGSRDLHGERL